MGFWRKCRIAFRCFRFAIWIIILLLLLAFAWINTVGLPDFLKTRLVAALHDRGVHLEFTRMRLHLVHGLICDNVRIGQTKESGGAMLTAREVQLRINYPALMRGRLQVDGLLLRQGNFEYPLSEDESLMLTNLQTELEFAPDDTWSLNQFRADLAGATFTLGAEVAHAPEFRNWKMFSGTKTADRGSVQAFLRNLSDTLKKIQFDGQPQLNARLIGDARNVNSFKLALNLRVPGVHTPWVEVRDLEFVSHVLVPTNAPSALDPAWGFWTNVQPFQLDWAARASDVTLSKLEAEKVNCAGSWSAPELVLTNFSARLGGGGVDGNAKLDIATRQLNFSGNSDFDLHTLTELLPVRARIRLSEITWAKPPHLRAVGMAVVPPWTNTPAGWQGGNEPGMWMAGEVELTNAVVAHKTSLETVQAHFACTNLTWTGNQSGMSVTGELAVANAVMGNKTRIESVHTHFACTNLAWDNGIDPATLLNGELAVTNALINENIPLDSLHTHFAVSNRVWSLPDLQVIQGRTSLAFSGQKDDVTTNFHCIVSGMLDVDSFRPFLTDTNAQRGFELLTFRDPVALTLDATGNLRDFKTISVTGRVEATDFAIRETWVDSLWTALTYTNLTADFIHPQVMRANGAERFEAEKMTWDISGQKLFIHRGFGNISPMAVGQAIGPKTAKQMEPYEFLSVPSAMVEGCVPLKRVGEDLINDDADLRFDLTSTEAFRWRRFETPSIIGTVQWLSNYLIITNVVCEAYGGKAHGWGRFNVQTPGEGTDFSFFVDGTNVDFNAMGKALWSPTNQLRGNLSGMVTVTSANSDDWRTWNGYGRMQLHNGLIWNAPIFGIMSPFLNALAPGMGNSKATDATGHFVMTNGVIFTDSLEIRSLTMRLEYVGTVDLDQNVNARARAQLMRNTPVIGSLFSLMLTPLSKVAECNVTGTLDNPKITPVYIPFPKLLSAPLHPIRSIEQMFAQPSTNNPAKISILLNTNVPPNTDTNSPSKP